MSRHDASIVISDLSDLADHIVSLPKAHRRCLVGIAGLPAGGKSTLASALTKALTARGITAANVPMDGFHLDNRILDARGLRARKGAPETFDAAGFVSLMGRMTREETVYYPLFDRGLDISIAGAGVVEPECDTVIVEGNYLLFEDNPWRSLAEIWDLSIWVDTPEEVIVERCVQRWLDHGHSPEAARARAESNDLANARRISASRLPASITLSEQYSVDVD